MRHALRVAAAVFATLAATAVYGVVPAGAAECVATARTTTAGVVTTTDGETGGPASKATAVMRQGGVQVSLPDVTSKAQFLLAPPGTSTLADVTDLAIRMRQDVPGSAYLPSYQLVIDPDPDDPAGPHFTSLVWEPYKNGYGPAGTGFRTYDVDEPAQLWWSTRTLPLVPGAVQGAQAPFTLKTYRDAYPRAVVLAYGWNFGKGSPNLKATVAALRFETAAACRITTWAAPVVASPTVSPSATVSASASPTATASAIPTATASATLSASPTASPSESETSGPVGLPADDEGDLPTTGSSLTGLIAGAVFLLAVGTILVIVVRRKRRHV